MQQPQVSLELDQFEEREQVISEEESLWMEGSLLSESSDWSNSSCYREDDLSSLVEWITDDTGWAQSIEDVIENLRLIEINFISLIFIDIILLGLPLSEPAEETEKEVDIFCIL